MIFPSHFSSAGNYPFCTSLLIKLHKIRLKYSCLGNDIKLLESVSIPVKQLNNPMLVYSFI